MIKLSTCEKLKMFLKQSLSTERPRVRDFKVKYGELSPHFPHTCFGVFCGVCYKKSMEIFDTHTYLNADDFAGREAEELALAKEMGVTRHNVVGFDVPTIKRAIELAE